MERARRAAQQDLTPTPPTEATESYPTGVHPYDAQPVEVARTPEEKQEQRSFFFWYKPEMRDAIRRSMQRLGLGGIAKRLLDDKKVTRDVTPPPHIEALIVETDPGVRAARSMARLLDDRRRSLAALAHRAQSVSPLTVISRGYALVSTEDGELVRSVNAAAPGTVIRTRLADGELQSTVTARQAYAGD